MFALLLSLCALGYAGLALGAASAVRFARAHPPASDDPQPAVSVLVAARNEEHTLPACLRALAAQDYPADRLEILVADDGSTDRTAAVIDAAAARDGRLRRVVVPPPEGGLHGKAHALHAAYRQASGELLLITDADCTPPPGWVRAMTAQFDAPETGIVCGVTLVAHRTLLERVQALDWLLLLTVAAAAGAAGLPLTAMGNNMAVRRRAYEEVGGYPALPLSVTEDYALFQAVHRTGRWRVHLLLDALLANRTAPLRSLPEVFSQRRRWARGGLDAPAWTYLLYGLIFLAHALLVAGLVLLPRLALPLLVIKLLADLTVLLTGLRRMGAGTGILRSFLPFEGYLFGYLIAMPLALLVAPRIRWKGRRF